MGRGPTIREWTTQIQTQSSKGYKQGLGQNTVTPGLRDLSDGILSIVFLRVKHLNHPPTSLIGAREIV